MNDFLLGIVQGIIIELVSAGTLFIIATLYDYIKKSLNIEYKTIAV